MKRLFILLIMAFTLTTTGIYAQTRPMSPEIKCDWDFPSPGNDQPTIRLTVTTPAFFDGYYNDNYDYINGDKIESLSRLEIVRNCYETQEDAHTVYTIDNPEPGKTYIWEDTEPIVWGSTYNWSASVTFDPEDPYNTTSFPAYIGTYIGIKPADVTVKGFSDKGKAPFCLDITLPLVDINHNELEDGLTKVMIQRSEDWGERITVAEITEGITPGASLSWIDEELDAAEGISYYYYVTAFSKYGHSEAASAVLKLGKAYNPSDITGISTVINSDKSVDVSWNMAEIGYDGGYVPLDDLRFTVKRVWKPDPADWMTEEKVIAENIECPEMRISDPAADIDEIIELHYEIIASYSDDSGSSSGWSRDIVLGPDYTLPYSDSFFFMPEGSYLAISEKRWMSKGNTNVGKWVSYTNSNGEYVNLQSRHTDNEDDTWLYFFDPYSSNGLSTELISHRINISDIENPVLSLWRHAHAGQGGRIEVFVDLPGNPESIKAGEISFNDPAETQDGWEEVIIPLNVKDCGSEAMNLRFVAYTPAIGEDMTASALCIDDVMIDNYPLVLDPEAEINDDLCVSLSWSDPSGEDKQVTSYEILRNGTLIALQDASETTYTDAVPLYPRVAARYTVKAIYDSKYPAATELEAYTSEFIEDDFRYNLDEDENAEVVAYLSDNKSVIIPDEARMYPVIGIAERAFAGNIDITSVTFPESVTMIGQEAFEGCSSLAKATFVTVTPPSVGADAFKGIASEAEGVCPVEGYEAYSTDENLEPLDFSKCSGTVQIMGGEILENIFYSLDGVRILVMEPGTPAIRKTVLTNGQIIVQKVIL